MRWAWATVMAACGTSVGGDSVPGTRAGDPAAVLDAPAWPDEGAWLAQHESLPIVDEGLAAVSEARRQSHCFPPGSAPEEERAQGERCDLELVYEVAGAGPLRRMAVMRMTVGFDLDRSVLYLLALEAPRGWTFMSGVLADHSVASDGRFGFRLAIDRVARHDVSGGGAVLAFDAIDADMETGPETAEGETAIETTTRTTWWCHLASDGGPRCLVVPTAGKVERLLANTPARAVPIAAWSRRVVLEGDALVIGEGRGEAPTSPAVPAGRVALSRAEGVLPVAMPVVD